MTLRAAERNHRYHRSMHEVVQRLERLLTLIILLMLGMAMTKGVLDELDWRGVVIAVALVFVVRPLAGWASLRLRARPAGLPGGLGRRETLATAFFGVRGIGSLYYLAFAAGEHAFSDERWLWSTVAFTILLSVMVHGTLATPVMRYLERRRERAGRAEARAGRARLTHTLPSERANHAGTVRQVCRHPRAGMSACVEAPAQRPPNPRRRPLVRCASGGVYREATGLSPVIASVPAGHVYVRHLAPPDGRHDGHPAARPAPRADVPDAQWWPPRMLEPGWVDEHADEFDVMHVHFGFDAVSPERPRGRRRRACAATASRSSSRCTTCATRTTPSAGLHDAQLGVLVEARTRCITLTPARRREIAAPLGP